MKPRGVVVSGSQFTWCRNEGIRSGSTFASDLQWNQFPQSFYIKSHKTGNSLLFLANARVPASNGEDLGGIEYISPANNIKVTVWNT